VKRISGEKNLKKGSKNIAEGKRSTGKPRKKWLDNVENDLKNIDFRGWRNTDSVGGQGPA